MDIDQIARASGLEYKDGWIYGNTYEDIIYRLVIGILISQGFRAIPSPLR
jgi:hypothetical protein